MTAARTKPQFSGPDEVGCGPGHIGLFIREHGRRVFGLDLSPRMSRLAGGRLDGALASNMRLLPFANGSIGGLVAFYSLIHVRRAELGAVLREFERVLRPGGRLLFSAHQGVGEVRVEELLEEPVPMIATLFELDELVAATRSAGLAIALAEQRPPYASEHETNRLYVEATRPETLA